MRKAMVMMLVALMAPSFAYAASCPNLTRPLSYGSKGQDASQLQNFLIEGGYLAQGNITGYFGKLTETALKNFQCSRGLVCTGAAKDTGYGVAGPRTREAIKNSCSGTALISDAPSGSCTFNNQIVPKGLSVLAYEAPSASYGASCVSEMRTCDGGYLSGSYRYASCTLLTSPSSAASNVAMPPASASSSFALPPEAATTSSTTQKI